MHQIRQNARSTSARRVARSTIAIAIALLVDRRVRSSDDRAARRSRYDCPTRDEHAHWSTIAIVHRAARRRGAARSGLSLSDLGSLSLSLSGSDLKWKWGGKMISRLKVKILVNQKSFFGRWYFPWLPNTPVLWKMISENNFHPIQTHT